MFKAVIPYSEEHDLIVRKNRAIELSRMTEEERNKALSQVQYFGRMRSDLSWAVMENWMNQMMGSKMLFSTKHVLVWEQETPRALEQLGLDIIRNGQIHFTSISDISGKYVEINGVKISKNPFNIWPLTVNGGVIWAGDGDAAEIMQTVWRLLDKLYPPPETRAPSLPFKVIRFIQTLEGTYTPEQRAAIRAHEEMHMLAYEQYHKVSRFAPDPKKPHLPLVFLSAHRGPKCGMEMYRGYQR